jgi:hypothetical protein
VPKILEPVVRRDFTNK